MLVSLICHKVNEYQDPTKESLPKSCSEARSQFLSGFDTLLEQAWKGWGGHSREPSYGSHSWELNLFKYHMRQVSFMCSRLFFNIC